jgi:hypothetical protein
LDVNRRYGLALSGSEREVAHLAFDAAEAAAVAAGYDAFLKYLVENRFMKSPLLRRGE